MKPILKKLLLLGLIYMSSFAASKVDIKAIGIPLADHYAGIVAYEKYRDKMKYANYTIKLLPAPNLVRAYFYSKPDADIAFNVTPMVIDMFTQKPYFKWVSLIHRDGNALVINNVMNKKVHLNDDKTLRKPDSKVADAFTEFKNENDKMVEVAIPSLLSTHTTIFYKYLKDNNKTLSYKKNMIADVAIRVIKPPNSPSFLKEQNTRSKPSAFEQSLPWPQTAESTSDGKVAWYSKDVMKHKYGHVECIIIAKNSVIKEKKEALREVIYYIHKAGRDIERARLKGGKEFEKIIKMIQLHIPKHSSIAIKESLRSDIKAINYKNLNIDKNSKDSFREIMNLAYEAGFIKNKIDIDQLADDSFSTQITKEGFNDE